MCGIVAYYGPNNAYEYLIKGLRRLEYRGYDSAGIALLNGDLNIYKNKGKVSELEALAEGNNLEGNRELAIQDGQRTENLTLLMLIRTNRKVEILHLFTMG